MARRPLFRTNFQFGADELAYISDHEVHLDHDQALTASGGVSYRFTAGTVFGDFLYGSGLRSGFANTDHVPEYHPLNAGAEHSFDLGGRRKLTLRIDVTNLLDESYELRDGSGIGVFAPQFLERAAASTDRSGSGRINSPSPREPQSRPKTALT